MRSRAALLSACVALGVGCELVADLEDRRVDPALYPDSGAGGASDGGGGSGGGDAAIQCFLAGTGDSAFRFTNLRAAKGAIDLCFRTGDGPWTALLGGLPSDCGVEGLEYASASVARPYPAGPVELKAVDAAADCDAAPLTSLDLVLEADRVHNVVFADPDGRPTLMAYREFEPRGLTGQARLRFMNAMAGDANIDVGLTDDDTVPATLHTVIGAGLEFGESPTPGAPSPFGQIDPDGYLLTDTFSFFFGASRTGDNSAFASMEVGATTSTLTAALFVVGRENDAIFRPQIVACNENDGDGVLATCQTSLPPPKSDVVVDVFAAELAGAFSPFEEERRPAVRDAIAQLDGDVLCVADVARAEDRDAIVAAAEDKYPYSVQMQYDESTPFTDARDSSGTVPQVPQYPPCTPTPAQPTLEQIAVAGFQCIIDNCSDTGDELGSAISVDCATAGCAEYLGQMLDGGFDHHRCLLCIEAAVNSYEPIGAYRDRCFQDPGAGWIFRGQGYLTLLSRYPFAPDSVEGFVYPSTLVRRSVMKATVEIGEGVDVYCTDFSDIYGAIVPYGGLYGKGDPSSQGWANEQLLQAQRLTEFVSSRSSGRRAIIAGALSASREYRNQQNQILVNSNQGAATLDLLEQTFRLAIAPGYIPGCTECAVNPLVGGAPPGTWSSHILLYGFDEGAVSQTERLFLQPTVQVDDGGESKLVPPSPSYGLRAVVDLGGGG